MAETLYWRPDTGETPEEEYERMIRDYLELNGPEDPDEREKWVTELVEARFSPQTKDETVPETE